MDLIDYVEKKLLAMRQENKELLSDWAERREVLDRYDAAVNRGLKGAEFDILRQDLISARNAASKVRDGYHEIIVLSEAYRESIGASNDRAMKIWSDKIPRRMMSRMEWHIRKVDKALSNLEWFESRT